MHESLELVSSRSRSDEFLLKHLEKTILWLEVWRESVKKGENEGSNRLIYFLTKKVKEKLDSVSLSLSDDLTKEKHIKKELLLISGKLDAFFHKNDANSQDLNFDHDDIGSFFDSDLINKAWVDKEKNRVSKTFFLKRKVEELLLARKIEAYKFGFDSELAKIIDNLDKTSFFANIAYLLNFAKRNNMEKIYSELIHVLKALNSVGVNIYGSGTEENGFIGGDAIFDENTHKTNHKGVKEGDHVSVVEAGTIYRSKIIRKALVNPSI